jgi:hypothetical protein
MATTSAIVYRIDASDCIVAVNEAWDEFARANGGAHLQGPGILGQRLWNLIGDLSTQEIYRALVNRVRQGAAPVRFGFRCDGPDRRRLLQMAMSAQNNGSVLFEVSPLVVEDRPTVSLLRTSAAPMGTPMRICGWCKRIPTSEGIWLEVEEAVRSLNLFDDAQLPALTHGICPACHASMMAALADPVLGASGEVRLGELVPVTHHDQ